MIVYIGIGSNLGERARNITTALEYLRAHDGIALRCVSSLIETEPVGGPPQPKFINGVARLETELSARQLLGVLLEIEQKLQRIRGVANGPRTIDLDILLYGEEIIREPGLSVPHPRMFERDFVLRPLLEISPQIISTLETLKRKLYNHSL